MTKQELCAEIAEIMEIEDEITESTNLKDYEEFDSLAVMSLVALVNSKFGKKIPGTQLQKIQSPAELIALIGADAFEG